MPSRRDQIKLTEDEQRELIDRERIVVVSSLGPRGWPHVMPLWYVPRDGEIWIWTYAKSQKVKNLERDPRATLLIETGIEYQELRGVQIEAEAELIRDIDRIVDYAKELTIRYSEGIDSIEGEAAAGLQAQAPKRVAIQFHPKRDRQLGPPQARRGLLVIGLGIFLQGPIPTSLSLEKWENPGPLVMNLTPREIRCEGSQ